MKHDGGGCGGASKLLLLLSCPTELVYVLLSTCVHIEAPHAQSKAYTVQFLTQCKSVPYNHVSDGV